MTLRRAVLAAPHVRLALAGDTMLGRGAGERLRRDPGVALLAPELIETAAEGDLSCSISVHALPAV